MLPIKALLLAALLIGSIAMEDASTDSTNDPVVIYSVSTRLGVANTLPRGSLEGGTTIYMKVIFSSYSPQVSGLDQTASNNAIYIGKYPCIISDKGVNGLFVNCRTTKPDPADTTLTNLPIVVQVQGKPDSTCTFSSTQCFFSYSNSHTPVLSFTTPRSAFPRTLSFWRGMFTVPTNKVQDIDGQFMAVQRNGQIVETNRCDRFQIQDDYPDEINQWDDVIACEVSADVEAGFYSNLVRTANGHQRNDLPIPQKKVAVDELYDSKIVPIISSLNTNFVSPQGQVLEINGFGFSQVKENNQVTISGQNVAVRVLSATKRQLRALIPPLTPPTGSLFFQGSGWKYTRYNLGGTNLNTNCGGLRTQIHTNINQLNDKIIFDGVYTEPDVQNTFGNNYGQYFRGFIKAPKTGQYKFHLASDDCSQVYIQQTPLSTDRTTMTLVAQTSWSPFRNYWYSALLNPTATVKSISDAIALTENEYYYVEIFHTNGGGPGYLTASLEVESATPKSNSIGALYTVASSYTPQKEVIALTIYNSAGNTPLSGTYKLNFQFGMSNTSGVRYTYTTVELAASATAEQLASAINNCGGSYITTVVRKKLSSTGAEVAADATVFAGFLYEITFESYRGTTNFRAIPTIVENKLTGGTLVRNIQRTQDAGDPISGTFQLAVEDADGHDDTFYFMDGTTKVYDLPFNVAAEVIIENVRRITGSRPLVWTEGRGADGQKWRIKLRGSVLTLNNFKILSNNLVSGSGTPDIQIETTVAASNNLLFEPIPHELVYNFATVPQVQVTVNNILGGCVKSGVCDFTLADARTPTVTAYTRTNDALQVTIQSGTELPTILQKHLSITFAGAECKGITLTGAASPYTVACTLEQQNGQTVLEAGDQVPNVHYDGIGFSKIDAAVTAENIPIVITSITPDKGSPDGGTDITIVGTGFPKEAGRTFTLTIGGNTLTARSVSNREILATTAERQGATNNVDTIIQFNGKSVTSNAFSYDDALRIEVTNLDFQSKGPTFKGLITVTGTNFGTDLSKLKVRLTNANKDYLCVVTESTGTSLKAYLRGGMPGDYRLTVFKDGVGKSFASGDVNKFSYQTLITSVKKADDTDAVGSEAGGTRLKIVGTNFIPAETIVFIGNQINWICALDEAASTATELYCTTPPRHEAYTTPQPVVVTTRVTLESVCAPSAPCTFEYQAGLTPTVDDYPSGSASITGSGRLLTEEDIQKPDYRKTIQRKRFLWTEESKKLGPDHILNFGQSSRRDMLVAEDLVLNQFKVYQSGVQETLTLNGATGTVKILFQGPISSQVDATLSGSTLTYNIPDLPQGDYKTFVLTSTGYANKIWISRIQLTVASVTPSSVVQGGQPITIAGGGFSSDAKAKLGVTVNGVACLRVQVVSPSSITCRTPRITATGSRNVVVSQLDLSKLTSPPLTATTQVTVLGTSGTPQVTTLTANPSLTFETLANAYVLQGDPTTVAFTINGSGLDGTSVEVSLELGSRSIPGTIVSKTATAVQVTFSNVPAGLYTLQYSVDNKFSLFSSVASQTLQVRGLAPTSTNPSVSYAGGKTITFSGKGFDSVTTSTSVRVCGFPCRVTAATFTSLSCEAPLLPSTSVLAQYPELKTPPRFIMPHELLVTSDSVDPANTARFFDLLQTTSYVSTAATDCFVTLDFGTERKFTLQQLRYSPRIDILAVVLKGAKFEYTTDGTNYQPLFTIDQTVHTGWNIFVPQNPIENILKIKFSDPLGASGSKCQIGDIELKGWIHSITSNNYNTPTQCATNFVLNGVNIAPLTNSVTYSNTETPIVQTVTPRDGSPSTQTPITIVGTGFVDGQTTVSVDGVDCVITTVSTTQIQCTTGTKDVATNNLNGVFQVRVNGNLAVNKQTFRYANRWSDINTWGGFVFPSDGDSVIVHKGMTLIVDQLTPKLMQILVEGVLTFDDSGPTSLDAHYIVIREGQFSIGSENTPHLNKVTITLRGVEEDVQMPSMGNKVLGCHQCTLDIHGKPRQYTWTLLSSTAEAGATQITVDDNIDWQVGERIVITSSDVEHMNSETRTIAAISGKTITLDAPLVHRHFSEVETYGSQSFPMKVEVGLLSRNIVIQGEASPKNYGGHVMIHGRAKMGAIGRVEYAEFINGGQPRIVGRYPLHFHLNGDVDDSYVRGNAIHDCYARCLTIHGVHYLKVQKNVCYNTFGHAIFFEDGIETNNVVEDNLVASVKQSWIMLQTDITVATYWVTNPQNIVRRNRSGGSEWYGFWYEIKENPDGPSATSDICPQGLNVVQFEDNYSHSNGRFGLRIFILAPRQFPCLPPKNPAKEDPFIDNPSLQAVFQKFWTWKNNECGILGEELGNVLFKDVMIADSKLAGFQGHKANYSREGVILENALIVGKSQNNANPEDYYAGSRGMIVPRTNGFLAKNVKLFNFGSNQALIESCSVCWNMKLWVQGGKNSHFEGITATNSDNAQKIFWQKHRREIFWDKDGSIVGTGVPSYIIPFKKHISGIPGCVDKLEAKWDDSIICDMNQVQVRDVLINNPTPAEDFQGVDMKVFRLDSSTLTEKMDQLRPEADFQAETMKIIKKSNDVKLSFASPFVTGHTYNIHYKFGASDFRSQGIFPSPYFSPTDKGIVLRYNYSANRETFDVFRNIGNQFPLQYAAVTDKPDPNNCENGQWFNDRTNKLFYICLSGKNKKEFEYVETQGVICRTECASLGEEPTEDEFRYWSDPTTWPSGQLPVAGESPTIMGAYKVIMDIDPPVLETLTVLGQLIFDKRRAESTLRAHRIWVKTGRLIAGSAEEPFPGKVNIILEGEFGEDHLVIDDKIDVSSKVLAVTRVLELYGPVPTTTWTRLAAFADAGATQITVASAAGWNVGDVIVLGPSGSDPEQREKKTISAISGNTITLDSALQHDHFGAPEVTIDKPGIGQLDMRAAVGHLTRNIKIKGGSSVHGWGCRVLIYQFEDPASGLGVPRRGFANLKGVEFDNCGQYDTTRSGLDFRFLNSDLVQTPSTVIGCTFHDSTGMFLTIRNSQFITVDNNVFFNGQKALVQINDSQYIKFTNNLMIYVTKRLLDDSGMANWAVFGNFNYQDGTTEMTRDVLEVSNNVGQGSQDTGFFFMATPCAKADQASFIQNQCSSTVLACYGVTESTDRRCMYLQGFHAYHSAAAIEATMYTEETRCDKLILVENQKGLVLKPATVSIVNNVMHVTNSFIAAVARNNCPKCYKGSLSPQCRNAFGIQLASISSSAFPPMSTKPSTAFDTICTIQRVDCRVYINNVVFDNFKRVYQDLPECGNNGVFRQHFNAVDMTGQHFLTNSPCTNCQFESMMQKLLDPNPAQRGWFGGCGSFDCTGQWNVLVEDQDGKFFGQIGQAISNNSYFGPNVTYCSRKDEWNGYWCPGNKVTVLNFMSTAPDFNKRLYSPVHLTDGLFFNELNSYHEWAWDGPEPMNLRESKFVGLISVNTTINMTNAGMNPTSSEYWLSRRRIAGSPEDWVIIKLQFAVPQIIQVSANGQVQLPGMTRQNKHYDLSTMTNICGANNYFFENRTIHFVVTGGLNCRVALSLKNTLQVSTRLAITTAEFFGDRFLQYAVAQLGGDPYNYFILGVSRAKRRFLQESNEVDVQWGIADKAEIGSEEAKQSGARLEAVAAQLVAFNPATIGKVVSNSVQIQKIESLNFPSTETKTQNVPSSPSGSTGGSSSSSSGSPIPTGGGNNGNAGNAGNQPQPNGQTTVDPPLIPDDSKPFIPNTGSTGSGSNNNNNNNQNNSQLETVAKSYKPSSDSQTITIAVSVVVSVIGMSLIIALLLWYRKVRLARLIAQRAQRVDNEYAKNNVTEENLKNQPIE